MFKLDDGPQGGRSSDRLNHGVTERRLMKSANKAYRRSSVVRASRLHREKVAGSIPEVGTKPLSVGQ